MMLAEDFNANNPDVNMTKYPNQDEVVILTVVKFLCDEHQTSVPKQYNSETQ